LYESYIPKKYRVTVEGLRPLLHNRFTPQESGKRKKEYIPEEEADKKLYKDREDRPYQPATHFEGAFIEAAKRFKWQGRKTMMDLFKSSVFISPEQIPFLVPEDATYEIDERAVVISRSRVLCWRPRWDEWKFTFEVQVMQPDQLSGSDLKEVIQHAGL
jgi:hypothetical protein